LAAELGGTTGAPVGEASLRPDLVSALLNLGYHRALAEKSVDAALKTPGDRTFERMLKEALSRTGRR
jgi:Holliday junction resolvasome RuvABC DNA-binding subunit